MQDGPAMRPIDGDAASGASGDSPAAPIMIPAIAADGSRFPVEKLDAHRRGLLHDAISVFVFAGDRLLIQQRALSKYHCGGMWANTCCTHPHWGETVADAAPRRLQEELGVVVSLTPRAIVDYRADVGGGLIEHERVQVFEGAADPVGLTLAPDPAEVMGWRWAPVAELQREADQNPDSYAPWFRIYLSRWSELGLSVGAEARG